MQNVQSYHSLLAYLASVGDRTDLLNRDGIRPEKFTFQATLSAAAPPVLTPPANVRVLEEYWFFITRLSGFWQQPATNPADLAKVSFTIADAGEARNFFRNAMNLANLVNVDSGRGELSLEVPYFAPPGATIQVTFATDFTSGAFGAAFKTFGVVTEGWLVHRNLAERCGLKAPTTA